MAVHVPVLLDEVLDVLEPGPGRTLLDGTLGLGGHALGWLAACAGEGRVVGIDRDVDALAEARARLESAYPGRSDLHHGSYEDGAAALTAAALSEVDAALLDLGASSLQLDDAARGFSFRASGPLDMRMDRQSAGPTAADVVNQRSEEELERILRLYGEEPAATRVARGIVAERRRAPFRDTLRLAEVVAEAAGGRRGRLHPATRVFQALRIEVNDELGRLERGLRPFADLVRDGGRMAVITFHRLEDRIVKRFFAGLERGGECERLPDRTPSEAERRSNPRCRSARLRSARIGRSR